jgi:hypothetical protein
VCVLRQLPARALPPFQTPIIRVTQEDARREIYLADVPIDGSEDPTPFSQNDVDASFGWVWVAN